MRIGESNPYRYIHIYKPKDSASNVEKTNNARAILGTPTASALSFNDEKINSLQQKDESIDKYQRKAIKEIENMRTQLKKADKEIRKVKDTSEIQLKCTIIARRIISGNKVPKSDYIYLAKNDSALYQKAIILRIEREKPLKFKQISEYEKVKCFDIRKSYMENTELPPL